VNEISSYIEESTNLKTLCPLSGAWGNISGHRKCVLLNDACLILEKQLI